MPNAGDHVLIAVIVVAYPLYAALDWFGRGRARLETGESRARMGFYRQSMIELWVLTPLVLFWWFRSGRTLPDIGLGLPGGLAFWIGAVLVVALAVVFGRQIAAVRVSAEAREAVRGQMRGSAALVIPRAGRERRMWVGVSLTAGFCEEVLYRAFLMWYLMTWLPAVAAGAISAVVFGVAHLYLGWDGVLRAAVAGAVFAAAYLVTGSLWVPVALHVLVDVASGFTGSAAFDAEPAAAQAAP